jgi:hypothetical protein
MVASKKVRARPKKQSHTPVGLSAIGSAGSWEIAVDEALARTDKWFLEIEGPAVYFYIEISNPGIINKTLAFIDAGGPESNSSNNGKSSLQLGKIERTAINLLRDDEYPDRVFILLGSPGKSVVRVTISGADLTMLANALRQVSAELEADGCQGLT